MLQETPPSPSPSSTSSTTISQFSPNATSSGTLPLPLSNNSTGEVLSTTTTRVQNVDRVSPASAIVGRLGDLKPVPGGSLASGSTKIGPGGLVFASRLPKPKNFSASTTG